jgi:hypothetical protein
VINHRYVNGIQEFMCNWEGDSSHQWCKGKDLRCNQLLEEYARKTGSTLDWRGLDGDPNPLLAHHAKDKKQPRVLTYVKDKSRHRLDWEGAGPKRRKTAALKVSDVSKSQHQVALKRPQAPTLIPLPRACKYDSLKR